MAYYYSNYHENPYHYQHNQSYHGYPSYDYNSSQPNYVQYYDTEFYGSGYQQAPVQSLIGCYYYDQHESEIPAHKIANVDDDPVSTGFAVSNSVTDIKDDVDLEENNREKFHGGYNMSETYGKPLPASDEICYPPTKAEPISDLGDFSYDSVPPPYGKEGQNLESEAKPTNEIVVSEAIDEEKGPETEIEQDGQTVESEQEEEEEEDDDGGGESDEKQIIRRQIPPGYGIEALDLCEGVFGGYFPCFWKRNHGSYDQIYGNEVGANSEDNYWKGAADYLFGNPNPYGGSMPEKGSYGDPVYSYQRHYPQQPLYGQVEYVQNENYSWLPSSGYH